MITFDLNIFQRRVAQLKTLCQCVTRCLLAWNNPRCCEVERLATFFCMLALVLAGCIITISKLPRIKRITIRDTKGFSRLGARVASGRAARRQSQVTCLRSWIVGQECRSYQSRLWVIKGTRRWRWPRQRRENLAPKSLIIRSHPIPIT